MGEWCEKCPFRKVYNFDGTDGWNVYKGHAYECEWPDGEDKCPFPKKVRK
jgi:hypothetical protein